MPLIKNFWFALEDNRITNSINRRSSEIPTYIKKKSETLITNESRRNSNSSENYRKHSSEMEACELHQGKYFSIHDFSSSQKML